MKLPPAIDPKQVGKYPALTQSGGGYFYDHVLEYRVWCHPEVGTPDHDDGGDYFYAFASYDEAFSFSQSTKEAEEPLVLVQQLEWVDEPQEGQYIHKKGERITEWRVEWLADGPRKPGDIADFINSAKNA